MTNELLDQQVDEQDVIAATRGIGNRFIGPRVSRELASRVKQGKHAGVVGHAARAEIRKALETTKKTKGKRLPLEVLQRTLQE